MPVATKTWRVFLLDFAVHLLRIGGRVYLLMPSPASTDICSGALTSAYARTGGRMPTPGARVAILTRKAHMCKPFLSRVRTPGLAVRDERRRGHPDHGVQQLHL